jgi:hypothetical protein
MRKSSPIFGFSGPFFAKSGSKFRIFAQKLPSRDRRMRANNLPIFTKNAGENFPEIQKKTAEI